MASFKAKYTEGERKAFGQLLRQLMTDKGVTGADLARRANKYISSGKGMDRSMISWYVNGRSVPTPVSLSAIAKVLDVDPQLMLPRSHNQKPGESAGPPTASTSGRDVRLSLEGGNTMHLMINTRVPAETGWKIVELLKELPQ
jgi:transcriptional regulator with XRE-family HTH domain